MLLSGIPISFTTPTGGSATPAPVVTDATGRAAATLTLGRKAGDQTFAATVDAINVAFSETGKADVPAAIAVAAGDGQSAVVKRSLPDLLTAKVTDRFDNPVPDAVVGWTTAGAGNLGAKQSTTDANGLATNAYTLGGVVGPESIVASIGSSIATFTAQALAAKPTAIAAAAGGGQSANDQQHAPLAARCQDHRRGWISGRGCNRHLVDGRRRHAHGDAHHDQ